MKPVILATLAFAAAAPVLAQTQQSPAPTPSPAPKPSEVTNAKKSIWTLNVTDFRKKNANLGGYTKKWNLSDLPVYAPRQKVSGKLRIWGSNYLKDGPLGEYWASEFRKFHPDIEIEYFLPTAGIAVPGVAGKVADLGIGRPATLMDHLTFEQVFKYPITEITAATGSFDVYGWSPGFIILVHKDNPIRQLSMKQLDGIFGGARNGGYDGSVFRNDYPYKRGANENIRTWGQLGLTGEWANRPIKTCGQSPRANIQVVFQNLVLRGSDQWVEGYQAFANYATPEGTINSWSKQVLEYAENNRDAICIASPLALGAKLKELPIQGFDGGPFVARTLESTRDRSYPLINQIFFYANKAPGKPMEPKVEEFLRFVLSQQGQEQIQREGRYTPLTAAVVKAQLAKLEPGAGAQ